MSEASQTDQNQDNNNREQPSAGEAGKDVIEVKEVKEVNEVKETSASGADPAPANEVQETKAPPDDKAEIARLRDQLLRTAADFDNYRKRTRKEIDDAQKRGREAILKDLLPVFDDLELAATYAATATEVKSLADGVGKVLNKFQSTLDRMGIKRVPGVGSPFDPNVHEAIHQLHSPEHPAGTVMAEVKPGYVVGDYLVRAASVVVSKGPPPN